MKRYLALLSLLVVSLACSLSAPTPVAWSGTPTAAARQATSTAFSLTRAAELTAMPTLPGAKTPTPQAQTPTATPVLTPDGPWLVFPTHDGASLLAYDLDMATTTEIDLPPLVNLNDLSAGLSPDGKVLLLRAGSVENLNELALYMVTDPNNPVQKITPLLSLYLQRQVINQVGKRPARAMKAVSEDGGIAWSGNSQQYVFTAALDSDSSDLYLGDLNRSNLERLTARYTHDLHPTWSIMNNWMIFEESDIDREDGTWNLTAVSAFRIPRFDETRFLYLPPAASSQESFIGWANAVSLISYSCDLQSCSNLRQADLENVAVKTIYQGHFKEAVYGKDSDALAMIVDAYSASLDGKSAGVYLMASGSSTFSQVLAGDLTNLQWSSVGKMFLVSGRMGVMGIRPGTSSITLAKEDNAAFSPSGSWLVGWSSQEEHPGIRLYSATGSLLQTISTESVRHVTWQADSKGFFMATDSGLYQVLFPDLKPHLITDDIYLGDDLQTVWLRP